MESIQKGGFNTVLFTYKRNYKKIKVFCCLIFLISIAFSFTFSILKFFNRGDLKLEMRVIDYINTEMERILLLKTREKQNIEFSNLKPNLPLEPIRMTLTTAVFKYTYVKPCVILKRIIYNPLNNLNEDSLSKSLDNPYICRTLKTFRKKELNPDGTEALHLWIFFEFLDVKISQRYVDGKESVIRKIMHDSLQGLRYLHSRRIAHLDMKIGNIMGKTTENGLIYKLIDFGYSQKMPETGFVTIPKKNYGTYPYKPPEVVFKNEHGLKSDIWSLGAICWFLSLQYTPFYLTDYEKNLPKYRRFLKPKSNKPEDAKNHAFYFKSGTSLELRDFVKKCMEIEPSDRLSAVELLKHPFIMGEKLEVPRSAIETDDGLEEESYKEGSSESSSSRANK
jgi:calcium/calmodulin-dependent protein kinase I